MFDFIAEYLFYFLIALVVFFLWMGIRSSMAARKAITGLDG
jgi:hypothetical protein